MPPALLQAYGAGINDEPAGIGDVAKFGVSPGTTTR
jgi:hypothetical protein